MTPPTFARPAAAALAVALFLALAGCGKSDPPKADNKPADKKDPNPPGPNPGPSPSDPSKKDPNPPTPAGPGPVDPKGPIQTAAEKFLKDLRDGTAGPDRLTANFLKVIGKPTLSPAEKSQGYSAAAAEAWLRRAGGAVTGVVGAPTGYGGPGAAVFTGTFNNGAGRFLLRMAQADGGWKVDWFQLGTAKAADTTPASADAALQDFAAQAFLDALTGGPMTREDRIPLLGGIISPKLRDSWAKPFDQDKDRGYDYNLGKLGILMDSLGGGAESYTRTPAGPDQFKVEITKGGMTKAYTLRVAKGPNPGEWLVDEFTPQ